ncbi:hypothetical protein [Marivita sp. S2033]|uniref:hypothetical protein n=1 Tax=Marivita sp. S2033 TaxID=3373187 RepID=UPI00398272E1
MDDKSKAEKAITEIYQRYGLSELDDIRSFSDGEILRIPGVGRTLLNSLRLYYPFDPSKHNIRLERDPIELNPVLVPTINLGSIHDVEAARVYKGNILIQIRDHDELLPIRLRWENSQDRMKEVESLGFGILQDNALVRLGVYFPELFHVRNLDFTKCFADDE